MNIIIAPTHGYTRDPAQKEINDHIKNQTDAVNLEQKIPGNIVPKTTYSSIPRETENKQYHDLRPIHLGAANADLAARRDFAEKENTKFINGVAFPEVGQRANECYTRLKSGDCMQNK